MAVITNTPYTMHIHTTAIMWSQILICILSAHNLQILFV